MLPRRNSRLRVRLPAPIFRRIDFNTVSTVASLTSQVRSLPLLACPSRDDLGSELRDVTGSGEFEAPLGVEYAAGRRRQLIRLQVRRRPTEAFLS